MLLRSTSPMTARFHVRPSARFDPNQRTGRTASVALRRRSWRLQNERHATDDGLQGLSAPPRAGRPTRLAKRGAIKRFMGWRAPRARPCSSVSRSGSPAPLQLAIPRRLPDMPARNGGPSRGRRLEAVTPRDRVSRSPRSAVAAITAICEDAEDRDEGEDPETYVVHAISGASTRRRAQLCPVAAAHHPGIVGSGPSVPCRRRRSPVVRCCAREHRPAWICSVPPGRAVHQVGAATSIASASR